MSVSDTQAGGWVLVPREPTEAMIEAFRDGEFRHFDQGYQAMLDAAPTAPGLADELARLRAQKEKLVKALKPFADALDALTDDLRLCPDEYCVEEALWQDEQPTIGDLRRARAALREAGE
ncbi:hypothetical protein [Enterovirga aerilata]|uniref:Uncharacterized protein n=1 Tax=Enterovirga aerilata TaxID=2730920 RepID=A0A849IC87_9HYPH|nr:hypothetical protein [Enterovirga sp. DB1703]NNM75018.1 hypothetical protein [Enterovirga sp. DB1703]